MDYNGFTKKDWIIYGVIAAVLIFISVFFGGCGSTRITTIPGDIRQSNAYIIGELAQSVNEFDRGLGEGAETLQTQLTELTISSSNMNKQLYDSETKSIRLENDCKRKNKIILAETLIITAHLMAAIALLVISSKGIKFIPDFVKILL